MDLIPYAIALAIMNAIFLLIYLAIVLYLKLKVKLIFDRFQTTTLFIFALVFICKLSFLELILLA